MARSVYPDFALANPAYRGCSVTIFLATNGVATTTKATLYADPTGDVLLRNPQVLDAEGKFHQPVYVEDPIIAQVSGIHIDNHTTGVFNPLDDVRVYMFQTQAMVLLGMAKRAISSAVSTIAGMASLVDQANSAKSAAETARDQTLLAFDQFDDRYLGVHAADPTTDNDGNPLFPGALYFQQTEPDGPGAMKVYTGVAWVAAYVSGDSVLTAENLLALLASLDGTQQATALTSLGGASTSSVDALRDVPQLVQTSTHVLELTDRGKSIDTTAGVTVPANSSVAFPVGATITITNTSASSITIEQGSGVTMRQAGTTNTGNRTLAAYGVATARKVGTDLWFISGAGIS